MIKNRIINFRPCVLGAILMCSAIFLATKTFESLWYIVGIVLIPALIVVYYCFKRNFKRLICFVIIFAVAMSSAFINISTYTNYKFDNKNVVVAARVCSMGNNYDNYCVVIVENVKINYNNKTYRLSGKTRLNVYGYDPEAIEIGDKLAFESKLNCVNIVESVFDKNNYYKHNIKYFANVTFSKTEIVDGKLTLTETIMHKSKQNLLNNLGKQNGAVAYAILFGDKTLIQKDVAQSFRDSGTAHLLAVSGLHVGFLISLLYFVIDKFKINKYIKVSILAAILLVYSYMCGFSPSVVRASIMGVVMLLCTAYNGSYDSLSSLGLSCMIILLFRPLNLFDAGFLMSYTAVLGIILLNKLIDKINIKCNILRSVIKALFLTLVAQIGVLPIVANYFGTVATYSILANLVIVPIFAIAYVLLCVINLLVLIMPFLKFLMVIVDGVFSFIIAFNNTVVSAPYAVVNIFGFGIVGAIMFYIILFTISRFVMLKPKIKLLICCAFSLICVTILVVVNMPVKFSDNTLNFTQNSGYTSLITTQDNKVCLVDIDTNNLYTISQSLKDKKINKVDAIIFTNSKTFQLKGLSKFIKDYNNPTLYLPTSHPSINNLKLSNFNVVIVDSEEVNVTKDFVISNLILDNEIVATKFEVGSKEIMFVANNLSALQQQGLTLFDNNVDILYIKNASQNNYQGITFNQLLCFDKTYSIKL